MSVEVDVDAVRGAIRRVVDPCSIATGAPIDLIDMGLLQTVAIERDRVLVTLRLTSPWCWQAANIVEALERTVGEVPGVHRVDVEVDAEAEWSPEMMASSAQARLRRLRPVSPRRPAVAANPPAGAHSEPSRAAVDALGGRE